MNIDSSISYNIENIVTRHILGGYINCWKEWGYRETFPNFSKFYYIVDGECFFKFGDKEFIAKKGQLLLIPGNVKQSYYHISDNYITKFWFHFDCTCNGIDLFEMLSLPLFIEIGNNKEIKDLFEKINNCDPSQNTAIIHQNANILKLLAFYIKHSNTPTKHIFKNSDLTNLLLYIDNHLSEDLTIEHLCSVCQFHPSHLTMRFKKLVGCTPSEYITNLRIEKATNFLTASKKHIQEISEIVGFKDSYYFSKVFKQKTGFSPTDYRIMKSSKTSIQYPHQ